MDDDLKAGILTAIILAVLIVPGFFLLKWSCEMEAKTFNKFTTGPKATWQDAMFLDLRADAK